MSTQNAEIIYNSLSHIPSHVGIIPDGNRTWAKENGLSQLEGHAEGIKRINEIVEFVFSKTTISTLSAWGLSTENLKERSQFELDYLAEMTKAQITQWRPLFQKYHVNFRRAGSREGLKDDYIELLENSQKEFSYDSNKCFVACVNYGGQDEIVRSVNVLLSQGAVSITKQDLDNVGDFAGLPYPELIIRTKGDVSSRLSGFMSWWAGYAELYFAKYKCPDLTVDKFVEVLSWFNEISQYRNFGK